MERRPSLNDRRSYALYLTEHGETFYQTIENRVREHEQGLESLLEPGEKDLLIDMLARLCQAGRNGGV